NGSWNLCRGQRYPFEILGQREHHKYEERRENPMKGFLLAATLVTVAMAALAQAQLKFNPNQVALLRWYQANQTPNFNLDKYVFPFSMTFDGAIIWVTNLSVINGNTIIKVRASDGAVLGTFPAGGDRPIGVAFDGANIWVANYGSSNLAKLRASDG